jgi:ATP-binding cassette subfamily F protein 3
LFSGDDVEKKIKILSGGEKARVALAKTIVSKSNFLMLDEPTNHLDMHSVELLAEALNKYEGSIILVSHDRFFISKTANKIWEIVDHKIKEFKGSYQEWVEWNERMARLAKEEKGGKQEQEKQKVENSPKPAAAVAQPKPVAAPAPINREAQRELQKQQRKLQNLEVDLSNAAKEKLKLESELGAPENYTDRTKFATIEASYKKAEQQLALLNQQYEDLFEKVMELEGKA